MANKPRLDNQNVLITGGAGGIGRAAAMLFAKQGANLAIIDRDPVAGMEVAETINALGGRATFFQADVSDAPKLIAAIEAATAALGWIDALFNHAGTIVVKALHETTLEEYDSLMAINTRSAFVTCKAVLPGMLKRGKGSIVITSSIGGEKGFALESAYCMTKGAVLQLARSISAEYREHGIRCNAICPGFVRTAHGLRELDQLDAQGQTWEEAGLSATQVRICEAEEAAAAALFLLSDEASFVNGAALYVDNGWASKG
ncbi:SDR family oxidoreductase [Pseudomonas sp. PDM26]|jgi:NAD(P)-dependent dehydrogenase (short-subunit alcohol dehydrogenase family)|uniref:SDR family NAD(P)-dependent oxidoreductase n=1 Tax=Pseudomonas sp. PDM26 TaxID=2854766 RepID=UPI001C4823CF|nr:SDR family oxidoreductase [Pseudomonas sp. PDM26]MBV7545526.1 SDR family oxidoreductase [Pseudomonas sp. PDM26]